MATLTLPRPRPSSAPSPEQYRQALAAMHGIAARPRYACDPCQVGWTGPETTCWNCGNPASGHLSTASVLQLLLPAVTPPTRKAHR